MIYMKVFKLKDSEVHKNVTLHELHLFGKQLTPDETKIVTDIKKQTEDELLDEIMN